MKNKLLLLLLIYSIKSFGQWTTLPVPSINPGRFDDIFFINDSVGWTAAGNQNQIYKTTDGGASWKLQFTSGKYMRCIEFTTPLVGFCGSLDSSFYKTTDGGVTWKDIANTITPKPPGICGLSAPTVNVIYGCGIWSSPAYVIKSVDGGNTWTSIDLSTLASKLVDIHFINADTGFVSGTASNYLEGGIILYTADGGKTWSIKHKTLIKGDYIWKMQTPDGKHYYGSVEANVFADNTRFVESKDGGMTWNTKKIKGGYNYIQAIGFIDSLTGWIGGNSLLLQTTDGGLNWDTITVGSTYNRFLKMNDSTAFLTGNKIYKYKKRKPDGIIDLAPFDDIHSLIVSPNPTSSILNIEMDIHNRTRCQLMLLSAEGKLLQMVYDGTIEKGAKKYSISVAHFPAQTLLIVLHTNEGVISKKVVRN